MKATQNKDTSDLELKKLEYWTKFSDYIEEHSSIFKPKNYKLPHNWYDLSLNTKFSHLALTINSNNKTITSQVYLDDNKELFDYLYEQKDEIENELKQQLTWDKKDSRKSCKIYISHNIDLMDEYKWEQSFKFIWMMQKYCMDYLKIGLMNLIILNEV